MNVYVLVAIVFVCGLSAGIALGQEIARRVSEPRHEAELQRMSNLLQFGAVNATQAVRLPGPPDAMQRLQKRIHDDRVKNGASVLIEMYREKGLTLTDQEAELQVQAMIAGREPVEVSA